MTSEKPCRKDKNQNIQVFVRLRPLNQRERDIKSLGVVEVVNNREVVVRVSQQTSHTKKFTFDRAFGPHAKQVEVYQDVVSPLIEEVLAGYNCTVFAYGQTGTGKTHTMVGEHTGNDSTWQNDPLAGIIPRALSQLFDELRISNTEYTVRVSYLELYNEELFDLLSSSEDNSKLRIYEDVTRKGSNIVNGLEEITVYNKNEVYKIMAQGQERKRVASTLMNAQSSRSHTVFTIVVHMKENSPEGEELVKIGKLNLVDLAGSENISKAGSDNPAKRERARECVNINQSLLTLGRVITALVERHPHIPYRESKLTRILQESLGGRTKTSIIATVSPGHKDLEETMSTLEYAHRAKNIQNKPEVNQKMTKKAILKEYVEEIDRLKRDLQAARDKNGVYLASDTFAEMTLKQEEQRKEIQELLLKKRAMEDERDRADALFTDLRQRLDHTDAELGHTKSQLDSTEAKLADTNNALRSTRLQYEEQRHLVGAQQNTEQKLSQQAKLLLSAADTAAHHALALHDNVDKRRTVESTNLEITRAYRQESARQRECMAARAQHFTDSLLQTLNELHSSMDNFTTGSIESQEETKNKLAELIGKLAETTNEIKSLTSSTHSDLKASTSIHRSSMHAALEALQSRLGLTLQTMLGALEAFVQAGQAKDVRGDVAKFVQQWYSGAASRVASLQKAHGKFSACARDVEGRRARAARLHRDVRARRHDARAHALREHIQEIEAEKAAMEQRLLKQLEALEAERRETEERLNHWMDEERRLLEERLARHVAAEKQALEARLARQAQDIHAERTLLEDNTARRVHWHRGQLEASDEEMALAETQLEECDAGSEELLNSVTKFGKEFDEGSSAVSVDMEVFSGHVVEVVGHVHAQLLDALQRAQRQVQEEATSLQAADADTMKQLTDNTDALFAELANDTKQAMEVIVEKVETSNTSTIEELKSLTSRTSDSISSASAQLAAQAQRVEALQHAGVGFGAALRDDVESHHQLEARYLAQEYKVYSPTGRTPLRTEYRYPRALAATSPHERILARFRAMRQDSTEEDIVVVESDSENNSRVPSDAESSASEDSAVVFAAPSPPADPPALRQPPPIVKCTSETDIYIRRKQEQPGKENPNRSASHKKPSKLPAPASHKKPLVERNAAN